jgi:hypothetical protein
LNAGSLEVQNLTVIAPSTAVDVKPSATLTVNAAYTVDGNLDVSGTLIVKDKLNVANEVKIENGGVLFYDGSGGGTDNGTVTGKVIIGNGAKSYSTGTVVFVGSGTNVVEAGGQVYFNTSPTDSSQIPIIGGTSDTTAVLQLSTGTVSIGATGYVMDGDVKVNSGTMGTYYVGFDLNIPTMITSSSTFTVPNDRILRAYYIYPIIPLLIGESGAKIVVDGWLDIYGAPGQAWQNNISSLSPAPRI